MGSHVTHALFSFRNLTGQCACLFDTRCLTWAGWLPSATVTWSQNLLDYRVLWWIQHLFKLQWRGVIDDPKWIHNCHPALYWPKSISLPGSHFWGYLPGAKYLNTPLSSFLAEFLPITSKSYTLCEYLTKCRKLLSYNKLWDQFFSHGWLWSLPGSFTPSWTHPVCPTL